MRFMEVFLFKQKTAYEMRISYWSSDVCSSDLFLETAFVEQHVEPLTRGQLALGVLRRDPLRATTGARLGAAAFKLLHRRRHLTLPGHVPLFRVGAPIANEIGRAACRERVWQYV